ncbi:MFS transporter [Deinococcus sp. SM5_A1]|uniref:MFS transporter n=1 Tax=Deinococcus sp. SM5_A1 TaxID=3379094 RepID=UPI00385D7C51
MVAFLHQPKTRTFLWMWFGQSISMFGSGMTSFAIGVWLYLQTGTATPLALSILFGNTPAILLSPVAGVIADLYSRKYIMLISDIIQALLALILFFVVISDDIKIPYIYVILALSSAASSFQWPAEQATVSLLIPNDQLGRANGLQSFGEGAANLAAPILAGLLVPLIGIQKIILIDLGTFLVSSTILFLLKIPNNEISSKVEKLNESFGKQIATGWKFIISNPGLLGLLALGSTANLYGYFVTFRLVIPVIINETNDTKILGIVTSIFGIGMLVGGIVMTAWGGPKKRIHGIAGAMLISGLLGQVLFGSTSSSLGWVLAVFFGSFVIPIQGGSTNAIWQSRTPKEIQGRVFALRRLISQITAPIGLIAIGPLVDNFLQPMLQSQRFSIWGLGFGGTSNSGYEFAFIALGLLSALTSTLYLIIPSVRNIEEKLPET